MSKLQNVSEIIALCKKDKKDVLLCACFIENYNGMNPALLET
jgi:hypothetical protein